MVKYIDMDKIFIKDVPSFCATAQKISGSALFRTSNHIEEPQGDEFILPQDFRINYSFEGSSLYENHFYLKGFWSAEIQLKCTYCGEPLTEFLEMHYDPIRLIDEKDNSLDYSEDALECRLDYFNLRPWLFSEIAMMVPISPKHASCALPFE